MASGDVATLRMGVKFILPKCFQAWGRLIKTVECIPYHGPCHVNVQQVYTRKGWEPCLVVREQALRASLVGPQDRGALNYRAHSQTRHVCHNSCRTQMSCGMRVQSRNALLHADTAAQAQQAAIADLMPPTMAPPVSGSGRGF